MFEQLPLRDIHLPDPVSWWPPAAGWWLLLAALVLALVSGRRLLRAWRRRRARRRLRRQALAEMSRIEQDLSGTGDLPGALERASVLLRRVALSVFPERRVAGRAGGDWAEWLQRTGPADLDPAAVEALLRAPYRPDPGASGRDALPAARRWIDHVTRHAGRNGAAGRDAAEGTA